ncbi:MAG: hypothetical protein CMI90_06130 [Pelagibacteraceae bacterium]|mgnify:CR=1 FL=1|nr:hypothetical protein [Pelagibacteraceae bacterium]
MGLYVRKKSNSFFKNFIILIFLILVGYLSYYYFFIYSKDDNQKNSHEITKVKNDFDEIVTKNDLNLLFENFIKENPEIILKSVKDYQDKLIEEEMAENKIKNIDSINRLVEVQSNMFIGSNESDKNIYVFVDYNCGYCLKLNNEILNLVEKNTNIKAHTVQLPLLSDTSLDFAKLVIASSFQGDFTKVHNYLYSNDRRNNLTEIYADLFLMNINIRTIKENVNSEEVQNILNKHKEISNLFKFRGTPAIIIGNQIIPGYIDLLKLEEIFIQEFKDA